MPRMSQIRTWLALAVLACAAALCLGPAGAAEPAAPAFTPVAHSALVSLDAVPTPEGLRLRVRRTQGEAPLSVTTLSVSVERTSVPATQQADGSWLVPWPKGGVPDGGLEVTISHDGIREVLSGKMPPPLPGTPGTGSAPGAGTAGAWLRDHKQLAWWILNITVVLIAAIAISRRMS
jgi:hypothetical protein